MMSILIPNRNESRIHEVVANIDRYVPGTQVIVCCDRESRGKGWALRTALTQANGEYICFLDGDMDISPSEILVLLKELKWFDIVVGKKEVKGPWFRMLITALSRVYIRLLFGIKVNTQTGLKIFRREYLPAWETDGWAFDIEILAKAQKLGYSMTEVPITAVVSKKIAKGAILRTLKESIIIWRKLNLQSQR